MARTLEPIELYAWFKQEKECRFIGGPQPGSNLTDAELTDAIESFVALLNDLPRSRDDYQIIAIQDGAIIGVEGAVSGCLVWIN
jgi:hypothetical protein